MFQFCQTVRYTRELGMWRIPNPTESDTRDEVHDEALYKLTLFTSLLLYGFVREVNLCLRSALEIYDQTGRTRSEHLKLQHSETGPSAVSGRLRFSEICMIWVQCSQQGVEHGLSSILQHAACWALFYLQHFCLSVRHTPVCDRRTDIENL